MDSWEQMSLDSLEVARHLLGMRHWRSCISRAYYAAYCALTGELLRTAPDLQFPNEFKNPPHDRWHAYIPNHFDSTRFKDKRKDQLIERIRALYNARVDADYRPRVSVDEIYAIQCIKHANAITTRLGLDR